MHEALNALYETESIATLSTDGGEEIDKETWERAVRFIHDSGRFDAEMLSEDALLSLVKETYKTFMKGVGKGVSHEIPEEFSRLIKKNVFLFSGCKTFHELNEVSSLLEDPKNGGIKPWGKFKNDVLSVYNMYCRDYLRAEYNYAEATAHMVMKWQDFERDKGARRMLQYRTSNDDRVRDTHRALHNITLPVDDPFWDAYLPPLGWNCRCTAVMVLSSDYSASDSKRAIKLGEVATESPAEHIFRYNPGKTGSIFPPRHPYFKGAKGVEDVILKKFGDD